VRYAQGGCLLPPTDTRDRAEHGVSATARSPEVVQHRDDERLDQPDDHCGAVEESPGRVAGVLERVPARIRGEELRRMGDLRKLEPVRLDEVLKADVRGEPYGETGISQAGPEGRRTAARRRASPR
jgi:hypothetical protein